MASSDGPDSDAITRRNITTASDDAGASSESFTPESSPPREPIDMGALEDLRVLLELNPGAERVTLRGKQLADVSAELEFLSAHFPQLRHLDLSENALASLPSDVGRKLPRLVALDLSKNAVAFSSPEALARALGGCSRLKSLSVPLADGVEDEQRLLELLPGLRILNGVPLCQSGALDAEASSRTARHSPPSSPQTKRDLRLRFQAIKHERSLTQEASPNSSNSTSTAVRQHRVVATASGNSDSVRPRELPATISDDRTDWRKLLKGKTLGTGTASSSRRSGSSLIEAASQEEPPMPCPPPSHVSAQSKPQSRRQRAEQHLLSTEAFLEELKGVVRAFHACEAGKRDGRRAQETLAMFEQLDKHVERLAQQLGAQERDVLARASEDPSQQDPRASVLRTRWSLLELCGAFGAEKANQVDGNLGSALSRLLRLQKEVLTALQDVRKHTVESKSSSSRSQGGNEAVVTAPAAINDSKQSSEATQQQLKVLLDVAESLESDLEGLQLQFQQEKARRELLEQENTALKRQLQSTSTAAGASGGSHGTTSSIGGNAATSSKSPGCQRVDKAVKVPPTRLRQRKSLKDDASEQVRAVEPTSTERNQQPTNEDGIDVSKPAASASQASTSASSTAQTTLGVRSLTLKQLLDLIRSILQSKSRSDAHGPASGGAPRETLEQHMYAYLNTRFGLPKLIVDYASAVWKASEQLAARDNEVAVFLALLRNHLDEGFLAIKRKLQRALTDLLRAYLQSRYPLKPESVVASLVKARLAGVIFEDEWTELLTYLYEPQDSAALLRLVKKRSEAFQNGAGHQQQPRQRHKAAASRRKAPAAIPYALFEHVLLMYQLQGRLKLLEPFRAEFDKLDADHVGVLSRDAFAALVGRVAPSKTDEDVRQLVETLDPCHHDVVTFSDAVAALLPAIRGGSKRSK